MWAPYTCVFLGGKAHLVYTWFSAGPRQCSNSIFTTKNPHGAHMGPICVGTCGFLGGKAHLVYTWFLAGPSRCSTCDFHYQKPTWGPHGAYMRGFWVGRPVWYTSGFCMGHVDLSQNPDGPQDILLSGKVANLHTLFCIQYRVNQEGLGDGLRVRVRVRVTLVTIFGNIPPGLISNVFHVKSRLCEKGRKCKGCISVKYTSAAYSKQGAE